MPIRSHTSMRCGPLRRTLLGSRLLKIFFAAAITSDLRPRVGSAWEAMPDHPHPDLIKTGQHASTQAPNIVMMVLE